MLGESIGPWADSSLDEAGSFSGTGDELFSDVELLVLSGGRLEVCVGMIL